MSSALHTPALESRLRSQLLDRRTRLESAAAGVARPPDIVRLLGEVDAALNRLDGAGFGVCCVCQEEIEKDDLLANPMARYCLCQLTPEKQDALQRDLDLAWHVQAALLPPAGLSAAGWQTYYRYWPHGPVSGDYCDLVVANEDGGGLYFMLGDVSGKGVAASLLMAHLNASLRASARAGLPPVEVIENANRMWAGSTLASHYATLVCGRASASGAVEVVNAGHCPPVVVRSSGAAETLDSSGLPLGIALAALRGSRYAAQEILLHKGDTLVLYTDGLTEATNASDEEYGSERLVNALERCADASPRELAVKCLSDLAAFLAGGPLSDDLTLLALGPR
jgi:sigma-B regulation protein RsbU (phosphoserine phosphatase)